MTNPGAETLASLREHPWKAALVLAVVLAWGVYEVSQPFNVDQGIFVWAADIVRHGGVMYRDAWETRGPAPIYFTALVELMFGTSALAFRSVDLVLQIVGVVGLFVVGRRLAASEPAGAWAAILYLVWYAALSNGNSAQPDGWVGLLLLGAVALLLRTTRRQHATMFGCGVVLGLCILNKPTYGLFTLLPVIYSVRQPWTTRRKLLAVAIAAVGCLVPIIITVLYFWVRGAIGDLLEVNVLYTARVYSGLDAGMRVRLTDSVAWFLGQPMSYAFPFAAAGFAALWTRHRTTALLIGYWTLAAALNFVVQHKAWSYEWLPLYAPFALLSGVGIATTLSRARVLVLALLAIAVIPVAAGSAIQVVKWAEHFTAGVGAVQYEQLANGIWGDQPASLHSVANYVRSRTTPTDYVQFWGDVPVAALFAGRKQPSRFGLTAALVLGPNQPYRARYRAEFLSAVAEHTPVFIVAYRSDLCVQTADGNSARCLEQYPQFDEWVKTRYAPDTTIGPFQLWQLKEGFSDDALMNAHR